MKAVSLKIQRPEIFAGPNTFFNYIQPRFAGGGNEPTNIRGLCSAHNQYRYTINIVTQSDVNI
jgi:hypothetical protein